MYEVKYIQQRQRKKDEGGEGLKGGEARGKVAVVKAMEGKRRHWGRQGERQIKTICYTFSIGVSEYKHQSLAVGVWLIWSVTETDRQWRKRVRDWKGEERQNDGVQDDLGQREWKRKTIERKTQRGKRDGRTSWRSSQALFQKTFFFFLSIESRSFDPDK